MFASGQEHKLQARVYCKYFFLESAPVGELEKAIGVEQSKEPLTDQERESPEFPDPTFQRARNQSAINLLNEWLADESGYDEEVWPTARKAMVENALSSRKRFDD